MKKRLIEMLLVLTMALAMSGCGKDRSENTNSSDVVQEEIKQENSDKQNKEEQKTEEQSNEESPDSYSKDLYYVIEDVFSLTREGGQKVLVVGYPVNGTIYTGMEMDVLTSDGRITTTVLGMEDGNGLKESCREFENAGILLDTNLRDSICSGDLLVEKGAGEKTGRIRCGLSALSEDCDVLADGMEVTVEIGDYRFVADTHLLEKDNDGYYFVSYEFGSEITMVNGQMVRIYDENERELAIGTAYPVEDESIFP